MKPFRLTALAAATVLTLVSLGVISHNLPLEPVHAGAATLAVTTLAPVYVYPPKGALPVTEGLGGVPSRGGIVTVVNLAAVVVHPDGRVPADAVLASAVATPHAVLARVNHKDAARTGIHAVAADSDIK